MNATLDITFTWQTTSPLSIHTGAARAGGVDRAVRMRRAINESIGVNQGRPELPGEAIKAAIREAAERILRWRQVPFASEETDARSIPRHPALARLFAPQWTATRSTARYWFHSSLATEHTPFETTSTSIDPQTGIALESTLRSVELWNFPIDFKVEIDALGGDWSPRNPDREDLFLLLMAITAVDSIGGAWGTGRGEVKLTSLTVSGESIHFDLTKPFDSSLPAWLTQQDA
jgi:CRISPR/Cas system CSM-associated protein Csm3 (group 7 of RAMP superfamily)